MPIIAFLVFKMCPGGEAKNDTVLTPSCHVMIITTKFREFLHNRLGGDSVTDGQMDGANCSARL